MAKIIDFFGFNERQDKCRYCEWRMTADGIGKITCQHPQSYCVVPGIVIGNAELCTPDDWLKCPFNKEKLNAREQ